MVSAVTVKLSILFFTVFVIPAIISVAIVYYFNKKFGINNSMLNDVDILTRSSLETVFQSVMKWMALINSWFYLSFTLFNLMLSIVSVIMALSYDWLEGGADGEGLLFGILFAIVNLYLIRYLSMTKNEVTFSPDFLIRDLSCYLFLLVSFSMPAILIVLVPLHYF